MCVYICVCVCINIIYYIYLYFILHILHTQAYLHITSKFYACVTRHVLFS